MNQDIEKIISSYYFYHREIQLLVEELRNGSNFNYGSSKVITSNVSDPTQTQAMKNVSLPVHWKIKKLETMIDAIDQACSTPIYKIIFEQYFISRKKCNQICKDFGISERTFRWAKAKFVKEVEKQLKKRG
jgi:hypothetical protein